MLGGYTLTGTGSYNGTSATGQIVKYTGPITISPNGQLTFNYTGTVTRGATILTAAGTMTEQFGPALTRSASGTYQVVSGGSGAGTTTLLNTGQMTGSQTVSGVGTTATNGSLALSYGHGTPLPGLPAGASGCVLHVQRRGQWPHPVHQGYPADRDFPGLQDHGDVALDPARDIRQSRLGG